MASDKPLIRICIRVFEEDLEKIQRIAEARGIATNVIMRECIHTFVMHVNDIERQTIDRVRAPSEPVAMSDD